MSEEPAEQKRIGGWTPAFRVVLYLVSVLFVLALVQSVVMLLAFLVMQISQGKTIDFGHDISTLPLPVLALAYVPSAIFVVLLTLAFVTMVDRRPIATLGFARQGTWKAEIAFGLLIGFLMPSLIFLISHLAGWTRISGHATFSYADLSLKVIQIILLLASVALLEETIIRGYVLQTLNWGYGPASALIASSMLFGAGHFLNPGAALPGFMGTTAAGLLLGYSYLVTRRLWMPIGIHFAWNLTLGPILGFPVSGVNVPGIIHQEVSGPPLWMGGKFGPEAGLLTLIAVLFGTVAIWMFAQLPHRPGSLSAEL